MCMVPFNDCARACLVSRYLRETLQGASEPVLHTLKGGEQKEKRACLASGYSRPRPT